jgi:E3 ubiquitin-protein ligase ATL41
MTKINVMISNAFILKKYYVIKWCLPYIGSTQILKKMLPYAITNKNLDLIIIIINYDYNYILSFQHNNSIIELLFIELVKNKNINLLIFIQNLNPNKFFVNINQPELSFIKGIKHTRFEDIQHEECNICLSTSESTVDIQINNCKHFFHKDCLTKWIKINNTCPTCRQIINSFSEIKLLQDFILPLKKKIKI